MASQLTKIETKGPQLLLLIILIPAGRRRYDISYLLLLLIKDVRLSVSNPYVVVDGVHFLERTRSFTKINRE